MSAHEPINIVALYKLDWSLDQLVALWTDIRSNEELAFRTVFKSIERFAIL